MILSMDAVYDYLEGMEEGVDQVSVRREDLSPWKPVSVSEAMVFAIAGCIEGRGSKSKFRFLRLLCSPEDAEKQAVKIAEDLAGQLRRDKRKVKLLAMDALQRMASARKFIYREQLFTVERGEQVRSGRWVFSHKTAQPGLVWGR